MLGLPSLFVSSLLLSSILSSFFALDPFGLFGASNASATSSTSGVSTLTAQLVGGIAVRVLDSTATEEISSLDFSLLANPAGTFAKDSMNLDVSTSNPTGYKLYLSSAYLDPSSSSNPRTYTTNLVNTEDVSYTIPTLSSNDVTEADFSANNSSYINRWGYSLNDDNEHTPATTTYDPIPNHNTTNLIRTTNTQASQSLTKLTVAINADMSKASGIYKNTLVFSAIANPIPTNYTLSFNLDGGSAPSGDPDAFDDMTAEEVSASHTFTIPSATPVKNGYLFNNWVLLDSAGQETATTYDPGDTITVLGNEEYIGSATLKATYTPSAPFWTITTMQEMTPDVCNSVYTPNNGTGSNITLVDNAYDYYTTYGVNANGTRYVPQRTLYDIRGADGTGTSANPVTSGANVKTYTIRKLADGNCWMTEHLQLPLSVGTPVEASYGTTTTSSISTFTYTPTSSASIGTYTVTPRVSSDDWNGYYYYHWYAATAERNISGGVDIDVNGSICPKGWRLPANYTNNAALSYGALTNAYGVTVKGANTDTSTGYPTLEASPLSLQRSGFYYFDGLRGGGGSGAYWSSTAKSTTRNYDFAFSNSYVYPQDNNGLAYGMSVRCLAVR